MNQDNLVKIQQYNTQKKNTFFSWFFVFLFSFSLFLSGVWFAHSVNTASPPSIITYQGKLLESGASVTTTKSMSFTLYDALSGGIALYTTAGALPTISTVSVTPVQGIFSIDLGGSGTNALDSSLFQNYDEVYLEIIVDGVTLTPRKRITASPYAVNARYLNGIEATSTAQTSTYIPISTSNGSFAFNTTTLASGEVSAYHSSFFGSPLAVFDVGATLNGRAGVFRAMSSNANFGAGFILYPTSTTTVPTILSTQAASLIVGSTGRPTLALGTTSGGTVPAGLFRIGDGTSTRVYLSGSTSEDSYLNTDVLIGVTSAGSITDPGFVLNGNDLFVGGDVGVVGDMYTNGEIISSGSNTSTFAGSIELSSGKCFSVDGVCLTSGGSSQWTTNGSDIYFTGGNVGIGITNPSVALDVSGSGSVSGDLFVDGTISVGGVQTIFVPDQADFTGTLFIGDGGTTLTHTAGLEGQKNTFVGLRAGLSVTTGSGNVGLGYTALENNTVGQDNTAIGTASLFSNIDGSINTAVGNFSLYNNVSGIANQAFGNAALFNNIDGNHNSAFGLESITGNTSGSYNSAFGNYTLQLNTIGSYNSAFGYQSMLQNNEGNGNSAFGYQTLTDSDGDYNSAFGGLALNANTLGDLNSAFGYSALLVNETGSNNSAFGDSALQSNNADWNSAFGSNALFSNTTGTANSAFGYQTLAVNTVGIYNNAFGSLALSSNISGNYNNAFGYDTLSQVISGEYNTAIGHNTGLGIETGSYNTIIGAQISGLSPTLLNNIIIADGAGNQRIRVLDTGYVGINTTTPGYMLSVAGNGYFLDGLDSSNDIKVFSQFSTPSDVNALVFRENSGSIWDGTVGFTSRFDIYQDQVTSTPFGSELRIMPGNIGILESDWVASGSFSIQADANTAAIVSVDSVSGPIMLRGGIENPTVEYHVEDDGGISSLLSTSQDVDFYTEDIFAITSFEGGVVLFRLDPNHANVSPVQLGNVSDASVGGSASRLAGAYGIDVVGNYAYVAAFSDDALSIIDISNVLQPTEVGYIVDGIGATDLTNPIDVKVHGRYAYVLSAFNSALSVIDVSNPYAPKQVGVIVDGVGATGMNSPVALDVSYPYVYVTSDNDNSITVVDVSDPSNPVQVGGIIDGGGASRLGGAAGIQIAGSYAYVASYLEDSISVFDISDPTAISEVSFLSDIDTPSSNLDGAMSVLIIGSYAYVGVGNGALSDTGISIIDISNPATLEEVGSINSGGFGSLTITNLVVKGGKVIAVTNGSSFGILDLRGVEASSGRVGSLSAGSLSVGGKSIFKNAAFQGGVQVSESLLIGDSIGFGAFGGALSATNTIMFSQTGLFESTVSSTDDYAFIFDTVNTLSSSASVYALSVRNGGTPLFSVATNGDVHTTGTYYGAAISVSTPGAPGDLAERVDIYPGEVVEPGDVLEVDPTGIDRYRKSTSANSTRVAGVVSTLPTIVVGSGKTESTAVMAMVGRVPVKVSTEQGNISQGDILVSASIPGYAMKYIPSSFENSDPVSIIGVALESFGGTTGKIMALVRSGWTGSSSVSSQNVSEVTIIEQSQGDILWTNDQPFSFGEKEVLDVATISGLNGRWRITENGQFVSAVSTVDGGTRSLYALQSETTDYVFSGSSQLESGSAEISFEENDVGLISDNHDMRIVITLTAEANGVYVTQKNKQGFSVRELLGGSSNATFDWVVFVKRSEQFSYSINSEDIDDIPFSVDAVSEGGLDSGLYENPPIVSESDIGIEDQNASGDVSQQNGSSDNEGGESQSGTEPVADESIQGDSSPPAVTVSEESPVSSEIN
jgi:hypothetical protein